MTVYLDNSFLNRPFDDPDIGVNKLEAETLYLIIKLAKSGRVNLVNSSVIEYENSLNPFPDRKIFVAEVFKKSVIYQNINLKTKKRANLITTDMHILPIDALHLASAEEAKVDLFISCDYNLIKKYKGNINSGTVFLRKIKTITPLEFLSHYEHAN